MTSGMNYFMGRTIEKRREPSGLELTRGKVSYSTGPRNPEEWKELRVSREKYTGRFKL